MRPILRSWLISWLFTCLCVGPLVPVAWGAPAVMSAHTTGVPVDAIVWTVAPAVPIVGATVQVTVAGTWSDSCIPSYVSHAVTAQTIVIVTATPAPDVICGQAETSWSITVGLGELSAATYQLQVTGAMSVSTTLTVLGNVHYLPLISGN